MQIYLTSNQEILGVHCQCAKGQATCSHMAAIYIEAMKEISCMDMTCIWKPFNRKNNDFHTRTLDQIFVSKLKYCSLDRKVTSEDENSLIHLLENCSHPVMPFILSQEPNISPVHTDFPIVSEIINKFDKFYGDLFRKIKNWII